MDDLTQLMENLFIVSKGIPEGDYLKMCNNMKNIHNSLKSVAPPDDDDDDDDDWAIQRNPIFELEIERLTNLMYQRKRDLKSLRIRKNITEVVKRDAIKEYAEQMNIHLQSYSIEELRAKGFRVHNERGFYKSYIDRRNLVTQGMQRDIEDEILEIRNQIRLLGN